MVNSILVLKDGKILVGGGFTQIAGQTHPYLARLTSDGQLDTTFPGGTDGRVYRLEQQPTGEILVSGSFSNLQGVARLSLGRLRSDGMVDEDFDAGGLFGPDTFAFAIAIQPDHKILVAKGYFPTSKGGLLRLNVNGQLDDTFVQTNAFEQYHIFTISPRTNGSILVAGGFQAVNGFSTPGLALFTTTGELNTNFVSPLRTNSYSAVYSVAEYPDGGLLMGGGFWRDGVTNKMVVAKLTSSLEWDFNFDPDVFDPQFSSPYFSYAMSIILQRDGKIVAGGYFAEVGGYWRRNIVRLDPQGHVDPCFDPGIGLGDFGSFAPPAGVLALAQQSQNRTLAVGNFVSMGGSFVGGISSSNIVRFLPQSDCDNMRAYLILQDDGNFRIAATFPPGGTNILQVSSNLVDWIDRDISTRPYCYGPTMNEAAWPVVNTPQIFVRGKKQY